jgi:hypothetical protein
MRRGTASLLRIEVYCDFEVYRMKSTLKILIIYVFRWLNEQCFLGKVDGTLKQNFYLSSVCLNADFIFLLMGHPINNT